MFSSISDLTHKMAWNAALGLKEWGYQELSLASDINHRTVQHIAREWRRQGLIEELDVGRKKTKRFRVVARDDALPEQLRAVDGVAHDPTRNMWTAMRGLKTFSARDVVLHANRGGAEVSETDATTFCKLLVRGNYLRVVPNRTSKTPTYRIIRDTGPKPPFKRRVTGVFDPNLEAFTQLPGVEL